MADLITLNDREKWLTSFGFQHDPFALSEAEKLPAVMLEGTFVAHPGFGRYVIDLDRSTVLAAPRGGGKTTNRLRLEGYLAGSDSLHFDDPLNQGRQGRNVLVIVYDNFEKVVKRLPHCSLEDHEASLLAATARSVYRFITAYSDQFLALEVEIRDQWWAFLSTYYEGRSLDYRIVENRLKSDYRRITDRPAPFQPNSSLTSLLEALREMLVDLGITEVFILIDGLDGYSETQSYDNLEALVSPLLNTLSLLSLEGFIWKFFLPDFLGDVVYKSAGHATGRLSLAPIIWDEFSLKELLHLHLEWASQGTIHEITQLCSRELFTRTDIEQELVQIALRHKQLGPPRALLKLARQLFEVKYESDYKKGEVKPFSETDWNIFIQQVAQDLKSDIRTTTRLIVMVNYSQNDEVEKDRLMAHLAVLQQNNLLEIWSDDQIEAGALRIEEFERVISQARIILLLITAEFLNSTFLVDWLVPRLMARQVQNDLIIWPIIVRPCAWKQVNWLSSLEVRPRNRQSIWSDPTPAAIDQALADIANEIADLVKQS